MHRVDPSQGARADGEKGHAMGRGLVSGLIWGGMVAVIVAALLSLGTPLPERAVGIAPDPQPDSAPGTMPDPQPLPQPQREEQPA